MYDPNALKVYTDGSAIDNPGGQGGFAVVFDYPDSLDREPELVLSEGYKETTNQRMELLACVRAFEILRKKVKELRVQRVILVTDSVYIYEHQETAKIWKKNDWCNSHGRPMRNNDLWNSFIIDRSKVPVHLEVRWQKGKTSRVLEMVDEAAKNASQNPSKVDFGYVSGRVTPTHTNDKSGATLFKAEGQEVVLRIYRYDQVDKTGQYEVKFDLFSEEEGEFLSKHRAYVPVELTMGIHGQHYYRVIFNSNPNYPMFESYQEINSVLIEGGEPQPEV